MLFPGGRGPVRGVGAGVEPGVFAGRIFVAGRVAVGLGRGVAVALSEGDGLGVVLGLGFGVAVGVGVLMFELRFVLRL